MDFWGTFYIFGNYIVCILRPIIFDFFQRAVEKFEDISRKKRQVQLIKHWSHERKQDFEGEEIERREIIMKNNSNDKVVINC
jgi:hypothetical protein